MIQSIAEDELTSRGQILRSQGRLCSGQRPRYGAALAAANVSNQPPKAGAWSLSYLIEPASVMKGIATAEAVEKNVATFDESFRL